jgi:hypothetical protein
VAGTTLAFSLQAPTLTGTGGGFRCNYEPYSFGGDDGQILLDITSSSCLAQAFAAAKLGPVSGLRLFYTAADVHDRAADALVVSLGAAALKQLGATTLTGTGVLDMVRTSVGQPPPPAPGAPGGGVVCKTMMDAATPHAGVACVFPFTYQGRTYDACTMDVDGRANARAWCPTKTDVNGNAMRSTGHWGYCPETCPVHGVVTVPVPVTPAPVPVPIPVPIPVPVPVPVPAVPAPVPVPVPVPAVPQPTQAPTPVPLSAQCQRFAGSSGTSAANAVSASATVITTVDRGMQQCVFPFVYIDPSTGIQTTYTACTAVSDADQRPWCSTKTNADGLHLKGNWGHCPTSRRLLRPDSQRSEEGEQKRQRALFDRDVVRRRLTSGVVAAWSAVGSTAGPPQCVRDCPGIDTVTDQTTLGCFSACAVTHVCVSDCAQSIRDMLASKKDQCVNNKNKEPPPPLGGKTDTEFVSSSTATTPVEVLPRCLQSCPGFQKVLSSQLNCAALKEWAVIVVGASASAASSFWDTLMLGDRRRLQNGAHACTVTCPDLTGAHTLASRTCSADAHT